METANRIGNSGSVEY